MQTLNYPQWICSECGEKHGRIPVGVACWHPDTCDICGKYELCTEPRDYGWLKDTWKSERKKQRKENARI